MRGLYSLFIENSHGDAVLSGEFFDAGCVWSNEVADATRVYNDSAAVGWFEGGN